MFSLNTHPFNNAGRIGLDDTDNSQRNLSNSRYADYATENHFSSKTSTSHVKFATSAPTVNFRGAIGSGLPGDIVDKDSELIIKSDQQRAFEKLQLNQRPYVTVPYLGRDQIMLLLSLNSNRESRLPSARAHPPLWSLSSLTIRTIH